MDPRSSRRRWAAWLAAFLVAGITPTMGWPAAGDAASPEGSGSASAEALKRLSLEQLLEVEVTSVSKRNEKLGGAPASIYLISADSIRRSGARTLPEALRLAPNLNVAQVDRAQWAISARGFNNAIGNKLLVLVDGRTVYTPLFSGVFWDQQEVALDEIDRIEVISGPGATLWGANAVNGVINVITREAADTTGLSVLADAGDEETGGSVRYGRALGPGAVRVYGIYSEWDSTVPAPGVPAFDEWARGQMGFRGDWSLAADSFTVQGDVYSGQSQDRGSIGPLLLPPVEVDGWNVLGRWKRTLQNGSDIQLQAYFDQAKRDDIIFFRPDAEIVDIEFQHGITRQAHEVLWGAGYRHGRDEVDPGLFTAFVPAGSSLSWANLFVQDEWRLTRNLRTTVGIKLEHNDYTGLEWLPNVRLAWTPSDDLLLWGAVSRAVRAPARFDREVRFPGSPPFLVLGGPDFESEVAHVVELGYRAQAGARVSYSVTAYVHLWDSVRSGSAIPVELENKIEGPVYGLEAWGSFQATPYWRLDAGFTYLDEDLKLEAGSTDPAGVRNPTLRNDPDYTWSLRSGLDLSSTVELNLYLRGVAELRAPFVPGYTELDARLAWRVSDAVELSITGHNLLHARHPEFGERASRSEIASRIYGRVRWRF